MFFRNVLVALHLCVIFASHAQGDLKSGNFNNFLYNKLSAFDAWAVENGMDPTPPSNDAISLQANSSFLQLNAMYWNISASNLSSMVDLVESNMIQSQFNFEIHFSNLVLMGSHESNGSIIQTYPLAGTGNWSIDANRMRLNFNITGFGIVNGFVNIDGFVNRELEMRVFSPYGTLAMPGFLHPEDADGLGRTVLEELSPIILNQLNEDEKHPLIPTLLHYLREIFAETSLADILNPIPEAN